MLCFVLISNVNLLSASSYCYYYIQFFLMVGYPCCCPTNLVIVLCLVVEPCSGVRTTDADPDDGRSGFLVQRS